MHEKVSSQSVKVGMRMEKSKKLIVIQNIICKNHATSLAMNNRELGLNISKFLEFPVLILFS